MAIPARVVSMDGDKAEVDIGGIRRGASLALVSGIKVGDYVLIHTGYAIAKIAEDEAASILEALNEVVAAGRGEEAGAGGAGAEEGRYISGAEGGGI